MTDLLYNRTLALAVIELSQLVRELGGVAMTPDHHRGIEYLVQSTGERRWKWEVRPPNAVIGWRHESGELIGSRDDAVAAAKRHIEIQDPEKTN